MAGPGIHVTREGWHAVGMAATHSGDVLFDDCPALLLTAPDAYLRRPGFWHGGAGIAACWHGAALPLAHAVRTTLKKRDDPHAAAHLAAIDGDLCASAALLRETARWIDDHPTADGFVPAMRARTVIEAAVLRVIQHAGNTLGAGPLCRDPALAALYADLPVLLRQSHAERDLAALGPRLAQDDSDVGALRPQPPPISTPSSTTPTPGVSSRSGTKRASATWCSPRCPRRATVPGFEAGCATGMLTERLAARCDHLLAVDLVPRAVACTRERVARHAHVEVATANLPTDWPTERRFDLVVLSEIGYFFAPDAWHETAQRAADALTDAGVILACHWLRPFAERTQSTRHLHAAIARQPGLHRHVRHLEPDFLLEVWSRNARPLRQREPT